MLLADSALSHPVPALQCVQTHFSKILGGRFLFLITTRTRLGTILTILTSYHLSTYQTLTDKSGMRFEVKSDKIISNCVTHPSHQLIVLQYFVGQIIFKPVSILSSAKFLCLVRHTSSKMSRQRGR